MSATYSVVSPFVVPEELAAKKKVNVGDGIILWRIQELLRPHRCAHVFPTKRKLDDEAIEQINATRLLIVAGANQLNDRWTVVPAPLERIEVPVVPFAVGIAGVPQAARGMSEQTKRLLEAVHERIEYSSWRCPLTLEYLQRSLPHLADRFLMTGCAVSYGEELLGGAPFPAEAKTVAVTVTERDDFWEREKKTIDFVAGRFKDARKILSLHQRFVPEGTGGSGRPGPLARLGGWLHRTPGALHDYARARGFEVATPDGVQECIALYEACDLHIGSRLHAHLYFLSRAKRSFLTYVDDRCVGFSRAFDFPVCDFDQLAGYQDYDFERYRRSCRAHYPVMRRFVDSVRALLES